MTPAEFKTRRQGLWLSDNDLATRLRVEARTVRHWESGRNDIPARATQELIEIEVLIQAAVDMFVKFISDRKPKQIALLRYRSEADMASEEVANFWYPAHKLHANTLHRIMNIMAGQNIAVGIVYFDPEKYKQWLNGREDRQELRAEWAARELK